MFVQSVVLISVITSATSYSCDTNFATASGTITTPRNSSSSGLDCTYKITGSPNSYLKLDWQSFYVSGKMPDCTENYVEVYTGCLYSKTVISRFCSSNMDGVPHAIYSKDNCMEIRFHLKAGGANYNGGFKATYQSWSIADSSPWRSCSSLSYQTSSSGVFGSPGWPRNIITAAFPLFGDCKWTISVYGGNKLIKLNFMDMDVSKSSSCSSWSSSYVKVEEEKSAITSTKRDYYYCQKNPFSLSTKFYELDVKMKVNNIVSGSGFVVGWVAYTDDKVIIVRNYKWIAGIVIGIIALLMILILLYRRYKKRTTTTTSTHALLPAQTTTTTIVSPAPKGSYPQQQYPAQYPAQPYMKEAPQQGYAPYQGYPTQPPPPYPGPYPADGSTTYVPPQAAFQTYPAYPPQQPGYPPAQLQNTPYPPVYGGVDPQHPTK